MRATSVDSYRTATLMAERLPYRQMLRVLPVAMLLDIHTILTSTVARLADPNGWCRGSYGLTADGDAAPLFRYRPSANATYRLMEPNPNVVQCCVWGHTYRATALQASFKSDRYEALLNLVGLILNTYATTVGNQSFVDLNDSNGANGRIVVHNHLVYVIADINDSLDERGSGQVSEKTVSLLDSQPST